MARDSMVRVWFVLPLGTLPFARRIYWDGENGPVAAILAVLVLFDVGRRTGRFCTR